MNHPKKAIFWHLPPLLSVLKILGKQTCKWKLPTDIFNFCNQLLFNISSQVSLILAALQGSYFHTDEQFMAISPIALTQTFFSLISEIEAFYSWLIFFPPADIFIEAIARKIPFSINIWLLFLPLAVFQADRAVRESWSMSAYVCASINETKTNVYLECLNKHIHTCSAYYICMIHFWVDALMILLW